METLTPVLPNKNTVREVGSPYFSKELRGFLAGSFGQSVFSFAEGLSHVAVNDQHADASALLKLDALQLYDFLLITSLQPQTARLGLTERVVKQGGTFTNIQLHFRHNDARLELALSDEPKRRKIQASLIKQMHWQRRKGVDFPFVGISATSWSRAPILTEVVAGHRLAGERFFPVQPEERISRGQFSNYFDELEAFQEYI